jgi:hypothetical protein
VWDEAWHEESLCEPLCGKTQSLWYEQESLRYEEESLWYEVESLQSLKQEEKSNSLTGGVHLKAPRQPSHTFIMHSNCGLLTVVSVIIGSPMRLSYFAALLLSASSFAAHAAEERVASATETFFDKHWPSTIHPQGEPDDALPDVEKSLAPESCRICHLQQYQDWQTSMHSRSMSPGIVGQLVEMVTDDPATARLCWSCHAPLAEQQDLTYSTADGWQDNPEFDSQLQKHGMMCASCHVRNRQYYGPPRRSSPNTTGRIEELLPHGSFVAEVGFTKSEFCRGCHQFARDDYALNGKLLENTYAEWAASEYADNGTQCQDCHMPDRRHLWRGIHDADMVRSGITISVSPVPENHLPGQLVDATISIENSGVGHKFPTYITPKVFVRGRLLTEMGEQIDSSLQEYVIGWESYDLAVEAYDTRLSPGQQIEISYRYPLPDEGTKLQIEVVVDPDHWYRRFYQNILNSGGGGAGREMLAEALALSQRSSFSIYEQVFALVKPKGDNPSQ